MSVTSRRGVAAVPHRVIQWGTGNTGAHTLRFLLEDPAFHVVGVWVKREQNIGRTAGELAGLGVAGGRAAETNSADPLISDPYAKLFLEATGDGIWQMNLDDDRQDWLNGAATYFDPT